MIEADWTKVVTQPAGLAGYALSLVFGYVAKATKSQQRPWLAPAAFVLAAVALFGGLFLSYRSTAKTATAAPPVTCNNQDAQVSTTGNGSPIVTCPTGPVNINVNQSGAAATPAPKPAEAAKQ